MQGWTEATILRRVDVGPDLFRVALSVAPHLVEAFHVPGQYHRVSVGSAGEAWFAIASAPGAGPFEYLVKRGSAVADAWSQRGPGETVRVSLPEGPGYPLSAAEGRPVVLVGTGTGFAPLRSALGAIVAARRRYGPVTAVYGVRTPAHLAFAEDFAGWTSMGVEVRATVSSPGPGWTGLTGRVQLHLPEAVAPGTVAFLCGQREMVREVTHHLVSRGVRAEDVFLNTPR